MAKPNNLIAISDSALVSLNKYKSKIDYEFFENFESEHTKKAYKSDLLQFLDFASSAFGKASKIERAHIIAYRNHLQNDSIAYSPKTIIRKLAAISSYCDFLIEKGLLDHNPTSNIRRPKDQVLNETNALTDDQVKTLLTSVDLDKKSGYLHKAVLAVLFSTGIRKSELIQLKFADYLEVEGFKVLHIKSKGGKYSKIPLHPTASYCLDQYLAWMENEGRKHSESDHLFQPTINRKDPDNLNKPLQPVSIDYIVKYYCRKIGLSFKVSPHSARATVISSLLESETDIYKVARLVNHSSVKTTQAYDKREKKVSDSPVFQLKYF